MPLLVTSKSPIAEFMGVESSHLTTQPAAAFGTSITPGQNTFGTAVQIGSDTTDDAYGIMIGVNSIANAAAKDSLTQIGFDFSGGTTFPASPDRYNSITLLTSCANNHTIGGVHYYFPLFIPGGTAIFARGSVNNATVGTQNVWWRIYTRPKDPASVRVGRYVESLGIVAGSSRGTSMTPGTGSEGTAVLLGTLDSAHPCWYWEVGFGVNDSTMSGLALHLDLLKASSSGQVILSNVQVQTSSQEGATKHPSLSYGAVFDVPGGTDIYGRAQASGTPDASNSMAAYGVGG